jgi:hypothetical protein
MLGEIATDGGLELEYLVRVERELGRNPGANRRLEAARDRGRGRRDLDHRAVLPGHDGDVAVERMRARCRGPTVERRP